MIRSLWIDSLRNLKREFYRLKKRPLYHLIGEEMQVDAWSEAQDAVQLAASHLPTIARLRAGSETVMGDPPYGGHIGKAPKRTRRKSRKARWLAERRLLVMRYGSAKDIEKFTHLAYEASNLLVSFPRHGRRLLPAPLRLLVTPIPPKVRYDFCEDRWLLFVHRLAQAHIAGTPLYGDRYLTSSGSSWFRQVSDPQLRKESKEYLTRTGLLQAACVWILHKKGIMADTIASFDASLMACEYLLHLMPQKDRQGVPTTKSVPTASEKFIPAETQKRILKTLEGQALPTDALAISAKVDRSSMFKMLKELRAHGLVDHKPRLGFYRPDALPPELVTHQKPTK